MRIQLLLLTLLISSIAHAELLFTHVHASHGAKSAITGSEFNETKYKSDELTLTGYQQSKDLGTKLKQRYDGFITDTKQVMAQSVLEQRCVDSAQAVLQGMFPGRAEFQGDAYNQPDVVQYAGGDDRIQLKNGLDYTISKDNDPFLYLGDFEVKNVTLIDTVDGKKLVDTQAKIVTTHFYPMLKTFETLGYYIVHMPKDKLFDNLIGSFSTMYYVIDNILCHLDNVPDIEISDKALDSFKLIIEFFFDQMHNEVEQYMNVKGAMRPILSKIRSIVDSHSCPDFSTSHDTSSDMILYVSENQDVYYISKLLKASNLNLGRIHPTSHLLFELHHSTTSTCQGLDCYSVKMFYGDDQIQSKLCKNIDCTLQEFEAIFNQFDSDSAKNVVFDKDVQQ